mmetsp:Transcript_83419/g.232658  ORF Transcript_83419/g.232658 Transcript_83419/m.232658 type:complete len:325 (-) Transcript_83419:116-1090(-)
MDIGSRSFSRAERRFGDPIQHDTEGGAPKSTLHQLLHARLFRHDQRAQGEGYNLRAPASMDLPRGVRDSRARVRRAEGQGFCTAADVALHAPAESADADRDGGGTHSDRNGLFLPADRGMCNGHSRRRVRGASGKRPEFVWRRVTARVPGRYLGDACGAARLDAAQHPGEGGLHEVWGGRGRANLCAARLCITIFRPGAHAVGTNRAAFERVGQRGSRVANLPAVIQHGSDLRPPAGEHAIRGAHAQSDYLQPRRHHQEVSGAGCNRAAEHSAASTPGILDGLAHAGVRNLRVSLGVRIRTRRSWNERRRQGRLVFPMWHSLAR